MSNWRQIRRLARCTAGVSVLSTFVGCRDQVQSIPTEPTVDSRQSVDSRGALIGTDASFERIAARAPSFAGAYLDSTSALVVLVTNAADAVASTSAAKAEVMSQLDIDPAALPESAEFARSQTLRSSTKLVRYTFLELVNWRSAVAPQLMSDDAVLSIDVDEKANRLAVGVSDASAGKRISTLLASAHVLDNAFLVFATKATVPSAYDVDGRNRPLTGGYYLGPSGCTLTGTALRGSDHVLLAASHCTAAAFSLDYGSVWQGTQTPTFGIEQIDPNPYGCGTLFNPKRCRRADIAAYNVNYIPSDPGDTLSWYPGLIAKTTYPTSGVYQSAGSKVIDTSNPYWTVTATSNSVLVGQTLHKVGNVTGWTFGDVTATCVDKKQAITNVWIVCSDVAGMFCADGDSGSPVFIAGWNLTAIFVGVVWGKDPGSAVAISNFGQMKQDLGTITFW